MLGLVLVLKLGIVLVLTWSTFHVGAYWIQVLIVCFNESSLMKTSSSFCRSICLRKLASWRLVLKCMFASTRVKYIFYQLIQRRCLRARLKEHSFNKRNFNLAKLGYKEQQFTKADILVWVLLSNVFPKHALSLVLQLLDMPRIVQSF